MGTFNTLANTLFDIKVNNTPSTNYTTTDQTITITAENNPNIIPADTLEKETNYAVGTSPQVPDNIVPGKITVKIKISDLTPTTNYLGLRLSADSAQTDFTFNLNKTQFDNTEKAVPSKNSAAIGDFAWSSVDISQITHDSAPDADFVSIPVEINYTGSTQNISATFYADIYTTDNTTTGALTAVTTISETGDTVPQAITITSYTAVMTTSIMAAVPTALTVSKNSFYKNDPIVLKTGFTTTTGEGYKPATKLILTNTITANITPTTLYASTLADAADVTALEGGIAGNTVIKIADFANLPSDVVYNTGAGTVQVTMDNATGSFKSLFTGTGTTLPASNVYIYIIGKVVGIGA